ncbi:MAG: nitroreductase family protein [Deltaproteobacteria bacterium TMED126]|jgi:nitroreductase|nr:nitroreductase family protein [Candidatus Dadabacteria bacterium]NSW97171.1 nitroreductase family protein [Deltaproteobacteria bacterium TMED126]|tara:strand:+ start:8067 stop:8882 length:816 start_codon:yes stop_codon:yes gene_type:complete
MALNYQSVDFVKVLGERRSCRFYDPDRPIEPEKIQAICQAARNASHMGNANCITVTQVTKQETKDEFTKIVSAFNIPMAKMAPVSLVFALDRDRWYNGLPVGLPVLFKCGGVNPSHGWSMDNIENSTLPRLTNFPPEVVEYLLSCETGMAMASAQLMATALGLGSCCYAGQGPKIAEVLGFPESAKFVWAMAIGYPGESVESMGWRERSPYGDIIFAEKFGVPAAADPGVDAELTSLGMMGEPSALTPQRLADINAAASKMGLPTRTDENG